MTCNASAQALRKSTPLPGLAQLPGQASLRLARLVRHQAVLRQLQEPQAGQEGLSEIPARQALRRVQANGLETGAGWQAHHLHRWLRDWHLAARREQEATDRSLPDQADQAGAPRAPRRWLLVPVFRLCRAHRRAPAVGQAGRHRSGAALLLH